MGATLGIVGPLVGIGSSLGGLFGGGGPSDSVNVPQGYTFANTGGSDAGAFGGTQGLSNYNIGAGFLPQVQQLTQSSINNPYAQNFQQGANTTGAAGMGAGQQLVGQGLSMLPDVSALLSMGFDPQNALYARTSQQLQDQTRAAESARGIANTPYGAGVEGQTMSNFNIDWQNNALARALQGASGAGGLLGNIGQNTSTGLGQMTAGAGLPYNTFQGMNANALGTIGQAGQIGQQAAAIPQQQIQDYLNYLAAATGQQQANNQSGQLGLNVNNAQFMQNQTMGGQLGGSLAGLAKAWPQTGWGGGGGSGWGSSAMSAGAGAF